MLDKNQEQTEPTYAPYLTQLPQNNLSKHTTKLIKEVHN